MAGVSRHACADYRPTPAISQNHQPTSHNENVLRKDMSSDCEQHNGSLQECRNYQKTRPKPRLLYSRRSVSRSRKQPTLRDKTHDKKCSQEFARISNRTRGFSVYSRISGARKSAHTHAYARKSAHTHSYARMRSF